MRPPIVDWCADSLEEDIILLFLERDKPWYAQHRDLQPIEGCENRLYESFSDLREAICLDPLQGVRRSSSDRTSPKELLLVSG